MKYANVVIPLAVKSTYTYRIPSELKEKIKFGVRVEVPFGKRKLYAALVVDVHDQRPAYRLKEIISVLDEYPVLTSHQWDLWKWMSTYYMCEMGEIMYAALPAMLKLHSETKILAAADLSEKIFDLTDEEYLLAEALEIQKEITLDDVRGILQKDSVYPYIKSLLDKKVIVVKEELKPRYTAKKITCLKLGSTYSETQDRNAIFNSLVRAPKQTTALMTMLKLVHEGKQGITYNDIQEYSDVSRNAIKSLVDKGIFDEEEVQVSRLGLSEEENSKSMGLSDGQKEALDKIEASEQEVILLHGVTGSGKTHIYIEAIKKCLAKGEQVLYLLPEIALTTQIVNRLTDVFAGKILTYHSRINEATRLEIYEEIISGKSLLILGARSSVFLPFNNLGLIIIDEEHDINFKQSEPSPRYNGRDTAVMIAHMQGCQVLLGSATPSIESYFNAIRNKYLLIELPNRYGDIDLPEIVVIDLKSDAKMGATKFLSRSLITEIEETYREGFQSILFINRRGFAPVTFCTNCGWIDECPNCDITLTYHKFLHYMACHMCGFKKKVAIRCPACGAGNLTIKGFGTEQLEDEIKMIFPELRTARLDLDTARGKKNLNRIIERFSLQKLDILIGTQMVTKGLDFDKVGLVGIISADQMLYYPDFRAAERAFQLMVQVSGRSGRKHRRGKVIIQTFSPDHLLIKDVINQDYRDFFQREIMERKRFSYPPFYRLIYLGLRHRKEEKVEEASQHFKSVLEKVLGWRLLGPVKPNVSKVRNLYIREFVIKMEKNPAVIKKVKHILEEKLQELQAHKGYSQLKIQINVDP